MALTGPNPVCLQFVTGLVMVRAHINEVAAVRHLSARRRNVSELYFEQCFSDVLAYRRIKSWHVAGFEDTVRLLATAQCQGPKLLSSRGTVPGHAISLSEAKKKKWTASLSLTFSFSKHITLSANPLCSLSGLAVLLILPFSHTKSLSNIPPWLVKTPLSC